MPVKKEREYRTLVAPLVAQSSGEKRIQSECYVEGYVEIYPQGRAGHGNDRKGDKSKVRYATIGFVAEYGTSSQQARPYMTTANAKAHEKVVEAQHSIWESETGK